MREDITYICLLSSAKTLFKWEISPNAPTQIFAKQCTTLNIFVYVDSGKSFYTPPSQYIYLNYV